MKCVATDGAMQCLVSVPRTLVLLLFDLFSEGAISHVTAFLPVLC